VSALLAPDLVERARALVAALAAARVTVATAESCTGGLVAACLTEIPGASAVLDRGFVVYSNRAKEELLGVTDGMLRAHGAVSEPVARAMAEGALAHSAADRAVAITGIAGPDGGTPQKPVGLVFLALAARRAETRVERHLFPGDRAAVRHASGWRALELLGGSAETPGWR
jgi:nicotinamide-nucleotide amidase